MWSANNRNTMKVLIPTDFSVQADYAYIMVNKLHEKMPMEIHFLHVMPVPDTVYLDINGAVQTCGEIDPGYVRAQKDIADSKLKFLETQYGDEIQTHLVLGKLTDSILDFSEKNNFDLIVMGTKGSWGLKEKISGSETQIIVRRSKVPVLSLMCDRSDLQIQNILMVHNFTTPTNEDLTLLHAMIRSFNTKVHLLQITSGDVLKELPEVENNMRNFAALNSISNFECHLIHDLDLENGVVHFNQMNDMDLLCIGTHGKGGLFHHSATEKLINHLFKPIISFHLKH